ncbi:MAG: phosphatase PAP2 family protein [Bdellovibrionota bacterium]
MKSKIDVLDQKVLLKIQNWRRRPLNSFFLYLTYTGTGYAWWIFALVLNVLNYLNIQFIPNQNRFLNALFSPLLAWFLGYFLKKHYGRKRPSAAIAGFEQYISPPTCGSFPSSHASASTAFFIALVLMVHPWASFVGVWAALISFSRLYLGVHYLSDVLAGAVLGVFCAFTVLAVL